MRGQFLTIQFIVLGALVSLLSVPTVWGWETLRFTPTLTVTGNYDDNIEFVPQDEIEDFYAQISPGIVMDTELPPFPLTAKYVYTRYQYRTESQFNRNYHYLLLAVPDGIRITRNLSVVIWDRYETVPVDVTLPEDDPYNLTQKNTFTVGPVWESQVSQRMDLRAGYEFSRVDYTSSGSIGDDYFGHLFFERLDYELSRRVTCFQRNSYEMKYFAQAPDYTQFLPEVGARIEIGDRVDLLVSGGYSFEEIGDEEQDGYIYSIRGNWMVTERIDLGARFRHRRTIDINGDPYEERSGNLYLKYRPVERLTMQASGGYYDFDYINIDSKRVDLRLGLVYELNRWSSLNCGYRRYQNVDMPSEESALANRFYAGVNIYFGTL